MKKVIAVVGCGRIANNAHLPALSKLDNVRIKYACDLLIEKAEALKEKFPIIENVITDYKVALADPEVEAVYVLTPNYAHYEVSMAALKAGKHVFCEKPITVNYDLSVEMAEEAKKQGKLLTIGVVNRFNTSVEMLKKLNEEGRFGNIYHVYCSFRAHRAIPGLGGDFTTKSQSGGGVLIDWGIHFFDLILYILGNAKLETVTCDAYNEMAKDMKSYKYTGMWAEDTKNVETGINDVDDFITGYVRTDKATISFNGAWAQNIGEREMFVDFLGDKAGARLEYGGKFTIYDGETLETINPEYEMIPHFESEDKSFIETIDSGEKTRSYIDNILESMKLLDKLYESAGIRKEIEL
ncbi:MAG: Gfo/Idh/MocA family oxidoreductase [Ruminococcaceae bacterium]|nr:Gfo/Idh/MocA family oxidoreductase [Oscillospiraceae bacterium]